MLDIGLGSLLIFCYFFYLYPALNITTQVIWSTKARVHKLLAFFFLAIFSSTEFMLCITIYFSTDSSNACFGIGYATFGFQLVRFPLARILLWTLLQVIANSELFTKFDTTELHLHSLIHVHDNTTKNLFFVDSDLLLCLCTNLNRFCSLYVPAMCLFTTLQMTGNMLAPPLTSFLFSSLRS